MPDAVEDDLPLNTQFSRLSIRLRLTAATRFHFNHGGVLRGLVSAALDTHEVARGVIPFAPESSRVQFDAGDFYNIGVTLVGDGQTLLAPLIYGLVKVGQQRNSRVTLGGNFDVVDHRVLPPPNLDAVSRTLSEHPSITLRFLSPFRLERPPRLKVARGTFLTNGCFPADHFLRRLWKRLFMVVHGRYPDTADEARDLPPLPLDASAETHLHWLDVPIESVPRPGREKGYTLGGVVGTVTLEKVPTDWIPVLALGRYLHAGESTNYGFGRYRFCEPSLEHEDDFTPAASMLDVASRTTTLVAALQHLKQKSDAPGTDGESPDEFEALGADALEDLGRQLRSGRYAPPALLGFRQRKADGRVRPLAIPTVRDRIVQRAVGEVLSLSVDSIFEDCSFAYRKGFSRQRAARAIEEAWGQGYRYVLDADISAFFDNVGWQRLFEKLHALFPFEPAVELFKAWVRSPAIFDERRIERKRGLPQGSPISRCLANLFLDEFDEELLGKDFRLVRFGDDFVVLCRDMNEARNAKRQAQAALERLELSLYQDKTQISAIDAGFTYLGYLFCRSLVTDETKPNTELNQDLPADATPPLSWLAQVPLERIRRSPMRREPW